MTCAACNSDNLRRVALVHQDGLSVTRSMMGAARTNTATSLRIAPPRRRGVAGWLWLFTICALIGLAPPHVFWIFAAGALAAAILRDRRHTAAWRVQMAAWEQLFMCQRCGWVGEVAAPIRVEPVLTMSPPAALEP